MKSCFDLNKPLMEKRDSNPAAALLLMKKWADGMNDHIIAFLFIDFTLNKSHGGISTEPVQTANVFISVQHIC